jgi:hypothetical protein
LSRSSLGELTIGFSFPLVQPPVTEVFIASPSVRRPALHRSGHGASTANASPPSPSSHSGSSSSWLGSSAESQAPGSQWSPRGAQAPRIPGTRAADHAASGPGSSQGMTGERVSRDAADAVVGVGASRACRHRSRRRSARRERAPDGRESRWYPTPGRRPPEGRRPAPRSAPATCRAHVRSTDNWTSGSAPYSTMWAKNTPGSPSATRDPGPWARRGPPCADQSGTQAAAPDASHSPCRRTRTGIRSAPPGRSVPRRDPSTRYATPLARRARESWQTTSPRTAVIHRVGRSRPGRATGSAPPPGSRRSASACSCRRAACFAAGVKASVRSSDIVPCAVRMSNVRADARRPGGEARPPASLRSPEDHQDDETREADNR